MPASDEEVRLKRLKPKTTPSRITFAHLRQAIATRRSGTEGLEVNFIGHSHPPLAFASELDKSALFAAHAA
jgi:hypothetical protein